MRASSVGAGADDDRRGAKRVPALGGQAKPRCPSDAWFNDDERFAPEMSRVSCQGR